MRRLLLAVALVGGVVCAAGAGLMMMNPAPLTERGGGVADEAMPFVVKLHARWCPVCMVTKGVWSQVQAEYGARTRMAVFDFTTDATTRASRVEAERLGLANVFDDYVGETGTVLIVDGRTRKVRDQLHGDRTLEHYRYAIDAALAGTRPSR